MPLPAAMLVDKINVLRRTDISTASRDAFNNPVYGDPTDWTPVYSNILVRLAYDNKGIRFAPTGELIAPSATMFYDSSKYTLAAMDHIYIVDSPGWPTGTEYVVDAVYTDFYTHGVVAFGTARILMPIT